jgi:hypothetical protein
MLPTEPLKIDLIRLAVVRAFAARRPTPGAGCWSYPLKDPSLVVFVERAGRSLPGYSRSCANGSRAGLEGVGIF